MIDGRRERPSPPLDELRRQTGEAASSLEDTFLTLVAEPVAQSVAAE